MYRYKTKVLNALVCLEILLYMALELNYIPIQMKQLLTFKVKLSIFYSKQKV